MNLFIDFSNEKDHPSIHDRYLSGRYSQTYPSRKQDTPEFFFPGTGIRTEERDSVYIQICILLRWETPKDHEAASIERICRGAFGKRSVQPEQIPDMKQYSDIILYGDASSPEAQQQLAEYLQQHNSLKVQLSFFDKRNDSTSKDEQAIAYAELQKALFFCQRKKIPLLFVSLKGMIDDIRFLNLLEESHVDFRCIDFPWFCKENLPLIKAVVLYEKLEIRINV